MLLAKWCNKQNCRFDQKSLDTDSEILLAREPNGEFSSPLNFHVFIITYKHSHYMNTAKAASLSSC